VRAQKNALTAYDNVTSKDFIMADPHHLTVMDPLSFCVTPMSMLYNDTELSQATGFFYSALLDGKPVLLLVSNWHVFAGRHINPPNTALDSNSSIPNRIKFQVLKLLPDNVVELHHQFANLYEPDGAAIWYQHSLKSKFDVAHINLGQGLTNFAVSGINDHAKQNDMKVEIGNDVFILGYPLGFSHFISTPIWKRGSIASEPHAETPESKSRIVIDATTRNGMSGSPVILREKTHYISENNVLVQHHNASRFLGVYSSRPVFEATSRSSLEGLDDFRTELGYVYKSGVMVQAMSEGIRGPNYGELP
jgi:hypothetical protein